MNSGDGKRRRVLSSEERVLWTTVIKSIAPLRESTAADEDDGAQMVSSARPAAAAAKPAPIAPSLTDKKLPPPVPLGRRMKQRVVRGKETIDGQLDLHGLTQSEAHATLLRFLRAASSRGARLVLVITGKGARVGEGRTRRSQASGAAVAGAPGIPGAGRRVRGRTRRPWRRGGALCAGAPKQMNLGGTSFGSMAYVEQTESR